MLSFWSETLMTLTRQGSDQPGNLLAHVGVESLFPIVPPGFETHVNSNLHEVPIRGIGTPTDVAAYSKIFFRINFGYMIPGAFRMTIVTGGITAYDGTLTGTQLEEGIDLLYFLMGNSSVQFSLTDISSVNQRFEMTSQFLVCYNEEDFRDLKNQIRAIKFPYPIPPVVIS